MPKKKGLEEIDGQKIADGTDPATGEAVAMIVSEGVFKEGVFQIIAAIRSHTITMATVLSLVGGGKPITDGDIADTFDGAFADMLADDEEEGSDG